MTTDTRRHWTIEDEGEMKGKKISLITPHELALLPSGTVLYSIQGEKVVVGESKIDDDTRFGFIAYGTLVE